MALIAAGFCLALGAPAQVASSFRAPPTGSTRKQRSVARNSRLPITSNYKAEKQLCAVTVSAKRASPQPYWRSSVSDNMLCFNIWCGIYKPDIVKKSSYTSAGRAWYRPMCVRPGPSSAGNLNDSCIGQVGGGGVIVEPVSVSHFPVVGENTGILGAQGWHSEAALALANKFKSFPPNSLAFEKGNFAERTGNCRTVTGNSYCWRKVLA